MALINCPECNKEVSDKSLVCIGCGYPLPLIQVDNETRNSYIEKLEFCKKCGEELAPGADSDVCNSCNVSTVALSPTISSNETSLDNQKVDTPTKKRKIGKDVLVSLFILISVVLFIILYAMARAADRAQLPITGTPEPRAIVTPSPTPTPAPTPSPIPTSDLTFGDTFTLFGFEITFYDEVEWLVVSEDSSIFRVPLSIRNLRDERNDLSSIFVRTRQYSPAGDERRIGGPNRHEFDFSVVWRYDFRRYDAGHLVMVSPNATNRRFMHFKYAGKGDYVVKIRPDTRHDYENIRLRFPISEVPEQPTIILPPPPSGVNEATYRALRTGMSESQVRIIMGVEPSSTATTTSSIAGRRMTTTILTWTSRNPIAHIMVSLSNGTVSVIQQFNVS